MDYQHIKIPQGGELLRVADGKLVVPDNPILGTIEGDGIGPEVIGAAVKILEAASVELKWDKALAGQEAIEKYGRRKQCCLWR